MLIDYDKFINIINHWEIGWIDIGCNNEQFMFYILPLSVLMSHVFPMSGTFSRFCLSSHVIMWGDESHGSFHRWICQRLRPWDIAVRRETLLFGKRLQRETPLKRWHHLSLQFFLQTISFLNLEAYRSSFVLRPRTAMNKTWFLNPVSLL